MKHDRLEKRKSGSHALDIFRDDETWVYDSSIDHKGQVPRRASTGVWKASLFIITIEFSERLSWFGLSTNLISYLTGVLHQEIKTAAKTVNFWSGVTTLIPLIGGFLADAYTGRFGMVMVSSFIYLTGLSLLTMSQFVPSLKPCDTTPCRLPPRKLHEVVLFVALYCISLGTGGHKPCLQSFGADQFDDDHPVERFKKMSYFNWWNFATCCGLLLGVTAIVYVQDFLGWGVAVLGLTIFMAFTVVTFFMGKSCYRYRLPEGSPMIPLLQVFVAAIRKRKLAHPSNPALLFEVPKSQAHGRQLLHTNRLRFLDKAAIIEENESTSCLQQKHNPWRLTTLTRVEEVKLLFNMIPIWITSIPFGLCVAQAPTFFVKQAATMNLNITDNFKIPPAAINSLAAIAMLISVAVYDKVLVPVLRKINGNERGMTILQRIGVGMVFSTASMTAAALAETKRLGVHNPKSLSVLWLAPQYIILGFGDGFTLVGLQEYFYDEVPDNMRSIGIALYLSVIGTGSFISSFLIMAVDGITGKAGKSWFGKDLRSSRLDNFYWLLAAVNAVNFFAHVWVSIRYTYKNVERRRVVSDNDSECSSSDQLMP
ncbi:hypothetical protein TB1_001421 [Malus domestica]